MDSSSLSALPFPLATMPAEWERQAFVLLIWPDMQTDWASTLHDVRVCYCKLLAAITRHEDAVLVVRKGAHTKMLTAPEWGINPRRLHLVQADYDDTWARDTLFLTRRERVKNGRTALLNFRFNGWGEKFAADRDNALNDALLPQLLGLWGKKAAKMDVENHTDFVLEGGSVESDGQGTILTTSTCLLAPHRNQPLGRADIEARLQRHLGASRVVWLDHGHLEGDDTDGHVDTLARFAPDDTILYVKDRRLADMERDLQALRTPLGRRYRLLPLPMPHEMTDPSDGHVLPASYANFLVVNGAVICPFYGQIGHDMEALIQIANAFPDRKPEMVDCRPLVRQNGSIHCATMQFFA